MYSVYTLHRYVKDVLCSDFGKMYDIIMLYDSSVSVNLKSVIINVTTIFLFFSMGNGS